MTSWPRPARTLVAGRRPGGRAARGASAEGAEPEIEAEEAPTAGVVEASAALEVALRPLVATLQQALEQADPPMTPLQLRCLHELEVRRGATVGDVAVAVGAIPSTASRTVDRLVAAGLVSRRAHAEDRRQVALDLTTAGRRTLAEASEVRAAALAATVDRMDDDDRSALLRGVRAFADLHGAAPGAGADRG